MIEDRAKPMQTLNTASVVRKLNKTYPLTHYRSRLVNGKRQIEFQRQGQWLFYSWCGVHELQQILSEVNPLVPL